MRTNRPGTLILTLLISLFSHFSFAQCGKFIKKADLTLMQAYEHCGNSKAARMYSGEKAVINQKVETNKRYRIMTMAHKILGEPHVSIVNAKGEELGIEAQQEEQSYWELMVEKDQVVQIRLQLPEEESTIQMSTSGCVAIFIGEMEVQELVMTP
jgi:predicted  nucleic acid-binding Zn-ribbon protein